MHLGGPPILEFRNQAEWARLLSYTPRGVTSKGWHEVAVHTKSSRYTVRARKGYDGG